MKNRFHTLCLCLLCSAVFVAAFSLAAKAEPIVIRFSHVVGENTPKGIGVEKFKTLVEQRLPGKVSVEIYPRSEKYTDEQALLAMLFGDLEMAAPSFPKFGKFNRALQIFDMPFLFESVEEVHLFQQSKAGQQLLTSMEDKGIRGLGYWDNGMRVISANRELRTPADFKGLTFRVEPSNLIQKQYAQMGAVAIAMPFKQLYDALKINLVDGYENAWSNILSRDLHTLRNTFTEAGHSYLGYMIVTSVKFWDSLPEAIRQELEKILTEVTVEVNQLALDKAKSDREKVLQTEGVKVITLSAEEKQDWKEALKPLLQEFEQARPDILAAAQAAKQQK